MDIWVISTSFVNNIVNNAAMNLVSKYLFESCISVVLFIYLEVELVDHMVTLYLIFWGTAILFSTVVVAFYIPTSMHKGSNFSTSSKLHVYFFDSSHPNECEVLSHCAFDLHLPNNWW